MNLYTITAAGNPELARSYGDHARARSVARSTVFIKGVNRVNLGAHLMLLTLVDEVMARHPHARLALAPSIGTPGRTDVMVSPRRNLRRVPLLGGWVGAMARRVPSNVLDRIPQVFDHQIDLVLDSPGFLYSDQWGEVAMARAARDLEGLHRAGARVILMPQAFGPFENPRCAHWMRRILAAASLVVARDAASEAHLLGLADERTAQRVVRGPDLTFGHILRGPPDSSTRDEVLIVPNYRMLSETSHDRKTDYPRVLKDIISRIETRGEGVSFLIHGEPGDRAIAEAINAERLQPLQVREVHDPLEGKRLVAGARCVIASRFHAVLAAFNTGVPCIGLGWSHKYSELFNEFRLNALYLSDWTDDAVEYALSSVAHPGQRAAVTARLQAGVSTRRRELAAMWDRIWQLTGGLE